MNKIWKQVSQISSPKAASRSVKKQLASSTPLALALEPRYMFDAAGASTAADSASQDAADQSASDASTSDASVVAPAVVQDANPALRDNRKEVAFVFDDVADAQTLIDGIADGIAVVVIDSSQNGLTAMDQWLADNQGYDAVHIYSHGSEGQVNLGTLALNGTTASQNYERLASLGASLSASADILLYGCNVTSGDGFNFIQSLAEYTQRDIAASDDATGATSLGGDWVLENATGSVETALGLSETGIASYSALLVSASNQNFDSESTGSHTEPAAATTISYTDAKGWTYTINNSSDDGKQWAVSVVDGWAIGNASGTKNLVAMTNDQAASNVTFNSLDFKSSDGAEFKLQTFSLIADSSYSATINTTSVTISGYRDGSVTGSITKTMADYTAWSFETIDVSADTKFQNVDTVRISSSSGLGYVMLDTIVIAAAVAPANTAPTITSNAAVDLGTSNEDTTSAATAVSSILTSASYGDTDGTTNKGIAVTGTAGNGTWQYSTDSGTNWYSMGTVSNSTSLLLDSSAQIRYVPDAQNSEAATISFRGWDKTSGSATTGATKNTADTSSNGGTTAFSSQSGTGTVTVSAVNDAPTISNGSTATLTAINEGATSNGTQISSLLTSFSYADVDTGASGGIAVTGSTGTGTWQYSTDNSTWTNITSPTASAAVLLSSSSYIRFISSSENGETATLSIKGWDQSSGTASTNGTPRTGNTASSGGITPYSSNSGTISLTVNGTNDAPTLNSGATSNLTGTTEDSASSASTVSSILAGAGYADVDTGSSSGIAITATTGNGTWQYSTDGTNWYSMGTVSASAALLLSSTSNVRYTPDGLNAETATFSFKAWDQTSGSATSGSTKNTANTAISGGTSAYSTASATASIAVSAVNDAPTINNGSTATLSGVNEGAVSSSTQISSFLTSIGYADVDTGYSSGIAIVASSGDGVWQYSTDNSTWNNVGTVSASAALLLSSSSYLRYNASGDNAETPSLTIRGWDQTSGTASTNATRNTANVGTNGGSTAFSSNTATASLTVTGVNDAPTLNNGSTATLTTTSEDATSSGTTVSSILTSTGYGDVDTGASSGIAITATTGNGTWQYTTNGTDWHSVGTVSASSALLLSSAYQVRYVPDGLNAETATFSFKAWDLTSGSATNGAVRGTANTAIAGGTTAFSTNSASASIAVSAANDAPTLNAGVTATLTGSDEETTSSGTTVSSLLTTAGYADVDTGANSGIAITGVTGNGTWQYSTDGTSWYAMGTVSATGALLLNSTSQVRYIPDAQNAETATFTYKAWDQSSGTASNGPTKQTASTAISGGSTAFSTNSATASIAVSAVNDAPTLAGTVTTTAINDSSGANTIFGGLVVGDVDTGATVTVTVTVNTASAGTLSGGGFTHQGGGVYTLSGVSPAAATTALDSLAFTPTNNVSSSGSSSTTFRVAVSDGTASYAAISGSLIINRVNDAPDIGATTPTLGSTDYLTAKAVQVSAWLAATDPDAGDQVGIAVTGVSEAPGGGTGTWEYSLNGGTSWISLAGVSANAARLLRSTDYVRYTPGGVGEETNNATITYRTWDKTSGTVGATADVTVNGNSTAFSSGTATGKITILDLNDAPTITDGSSSTLTTINEDQTSSTTQVSALLTSANYADIDTGAISGIAVTGSSGNGTWQFSTDGTTWTSIGTPSAAAAVLLSSTTQVRFVANGENGGAASLTYKAWDQTDGNASINGTARTGDASTNGARTAYSSGNATYNLTVTPVNDAPTMTNGATATLTATDENTNSSATAISAVLTAASHADVDTGAQSGAAITGVTGNGTWQFTTDGTTWTGFGTVSATNALLLTSATQVRYVPDSANGETATFTFKAWDQSSGTASLSGSASYATTATAGGTSAFSTSNATASLAVSSINDAPVMTVTTTINSTPITEEQTSSAMTVAGLITVTDADTGAAPSGIALTAVNGNGVLQYTLDGTNWNAVGAVSATSALLLGPTAQLRYVGDGANAETASFTYRAWDQTSGAAGNKVDASSNGGSTAFSSATRSASLPVTAVNDAPTIGAGTSLSLTNTNENTPSTAVAANDILAASSYQDQDTSSVKGLAITAVTGNGTWQYSLDGTNWTGFGTVSTASALLLSGATQIRYMPDGQNSETATFTYRAWDQTSGTASTQGSPSTANSSATGTSTAFSAQSGTTSVSVTAVNDAPVMTTTTPVTLPTINEDQTSTPVAVSGLVNASDVDTGAAAAGIAITSVTGNGTLQYSLDGTTWNAVGTVSGGAALLLSPTAQIRYVGDGVNGETASFTYRAWDQTSGTAGQKVNASATGNATAFSTDTRSASLTVTAVNDGPQVVNPTQAPMTVPFARPTTFVLPANTFSDVDSTLTYGARMADGSPLPSWITFDPATRTLGVRGMVSGTHSIVFTASDGQAAEVTSTMDLAVRPAPDNAIQNPNRPGVPMGGLPSGPPSQPPAPGAQPLLRTGENLGNTGTPVSFGLGIAAQNSGFGGQSFTSTNPIPTTVTGDLGSTSQIGNSGTPVSSSLSGNTLSGFAPTGNGNLNRGNGFGGPIGRGFGSAAGGFGSAAGGFGGQQSGGPTDGAGNAPGAAAADGTPPADNDAQAAGGETGNQNAQDGTGDGGDQATLFPADPDMTDALAAIPFSQQLAQAGGGLWGDQGALFDAIEAHVLPNNAA